MSLKSCVHSTSRRRQFEIYVFAFDPRFDDLTRHFPTAARWRCRHAMRRFIRGTSTDHVMTMASPPTPARFRGFSFFSRRDLNTLTQSAMMQRDTLSNVVIGRWRTFAPAIMISKDFFLIRSKGSPITRRRQRRTNREKSVFECLMTLISQKHENICRWRTKTTLR